MAILHISLPVAVTSADEATFALNRPRIERDVNAKHIIFRPIYDDQSFTTTFLYANISEPALRQMPRNLFAHPPTATYFLNTSTHQLPCIFLSHHIKLLLCFQQLPSTANTAHIRQDLAADRYLGLAAAPALHSEKVGY